MNLIELNEFNLDLLKSLATTLDLKNIKTVLKMKNSEIFTADSDENDTLDPWVQWVSIHTGVPFARHQVKRLGDVPNLDISLLWEKLSTMGVSSGVWGVLNGERKGENCKFFLPDPWTYSEPGYPDEIKKLVAFPRYMAKHRVGYSIMKVMGHVFKFLGAALRHPKACFKVALELPNIIFTTIWYRAPFAFFLPAEYLTTLIYCEYREKHRPHFSLIFLNGIAHLQHYYWNSKNGIDSYPLRYGFRLIDKMLGEILAQIGSNEAVMLTNGFSQICTIEEPEWRSYRPTNHDKFLREFAINFIEVEELMTVDAHILFSNSEDARAAVKKLSSIVINGEPLFYVEPNQKDERKIFYKVRVTFPITSEAKFSLAGKEYYFYDYFSNLGSRTGRHCAKGDLFFSNLDIPAKMANHEIYNIVTNYFQLTLSKLA